MFPLISLNGVNFIYFFAIHLEMDLNYTQKKVLCALHAYPQYTDKEIAEVLGSKRSTVTIARHFLQKNKYYDTFLIPSYLSFNLSFLGVKYGDYGKINHIEYNERMA